MKMTKWIVATTLILLCACGDKGDTKKKTGGDPTNNGMNNVTDQTSCSGNPDPNATVFESWHQYWSGDGVAVDETFIIGPNTMAIQKNCNYASGPAVGVTVNVPIQVNGNQISVAQTAQNTSKVTYNGSSYACSITFPQGDYAYAFSGNCLALHTGNGASSYYVP